MLCDSYAILEIGKARWSILVSICIVCTLGMSPFSLFLSPQAWAWGGEPWVRLVMRGDQEGALSLSQASWKLGM